MPKIKKILAREILDSRGNPTIEVEVYSDMFFGGAAVPSGASTGKHEAHELRDGGKRYFGKGVKKAVKNVSKIAKSLKGKDFTQEELDARLIELDGTQNKTKYGANTLLGISLAYARLLSIEKGVSLYKLFGKKVMPTPFMNVINGGKHAGNKLAVQEFMIVPKARSFKEALRMGSETYHVLKGIIEKKYGKDATNVGDEGGFAPNINKVEDALKLLVEAIKKAGYKGKIKIAMDAAASEFFDGRKYTIDGKKMSSEELLLFYQSLIKKYPIISLEDPFDQEDFHSFASLLKKAGKRTQIVGDDLLVTNVDRIQLAHSLNACNALLLKVNQIGTLSEAIDAATLAQSYGWNVMVSHRSGETEDPFIADLVVGLGTGQLKSGAPCRSERVAKYNQLLRIEDEKK